MELTAWDRLVFSVKSEGEIYPFGLIKYVGLQKP